MCNVSEILKFVLFADDTNLFISGNNVEYLCKQINNELAKINLWFKLNKLSLNISKTNFMIFSNNSLEGKNINLQIDGKVIEQVCETKFLGVIIDNKLNWKTHILHVKNKLNKCISVMYKASQLLETDSLRTLYCSLYLPYLSYCCEIWGTTYKQAIDCIVKSQKRAIRIVCKARKCTHTNELFLMLKVLKFHDLINYKVALIMYKARNGCLPTNVQKYFAVTGNHYNLRRKDNFKKVHIRTTKKSHCISVYGVKLYNNLSVELKSSKNIYRFKSQYKQKVFNMYTSQSLACGPNLLNVLK